jgi:hypothetical protein
LEDIMTTATTLTMHGDTPELSYQGVTYKRDELGNFEVPREAAEVLQWHGLKIGPNPATVKAEEVAEVVPEAAPVVAEPVLPPEPQPPQAVVEQPAVVQAPKGKKHRR